MNNECRDSENSDLYDQYSDINYQVYDECSCSNKRCNLNNCESSDNCVCNNKSCSDINCFCYQCPLTGSEIWKKYKDAVVTLGMALNTPDGRKSRGFCSGWFVTPNGYIVTAGHCVQFEPDWYLEKRNPTPEELLVYPTVVDIIVVDVLNYNGSGKNISVLAKLIGVDGAGDVALLKIEDENLTHQNYLEFDLCGIKTGDPAYIIGNPGFLDSEAIAHGIITDNNYFMTHMPAIPLMTSDITATSGNSGSPTFNEYGKVVGILNTGSAAFDHSGIISSRFVKKIVEVFLTGDGVSSSKNKSLCLPSPYVNHLKVVDGYFRYLKNWLGFINYIYIYEMIGLLVLLNVDLNLVFPYNMNGIVGLNDTLGRVGDVTIFEKINNVKLGYHSDQGFISDVTWFQNIGSKTSLTVRKANNIIQGVPFPDKFQTSEVVVLDYIFFPPGFDFVLFSAASLSKVMDENKNNITKIKEYIDNILTKNNNGVN
jgi:S1-C subfamily serine protease